MIVAERKSLVIAPLAILVMACLAVFTAPKMTQAAVGTGYVATVNGNNEFAITGTGGVHYNVQPDTDYNWFNPDGSLVTYTRSGVTANRDGMKTFAATDAAFGTAFGSLKLEFEYATSALTDSDGYPYGNYPSINVSITDGAGTYAIWSATSGGTGFTTAAVAGRTGWSKLTLDCAAFADGSVFGKINECTDTSVLENGKLNTTSVQWSDIKDWTLAGFYAEQYAPTGDWDDWGVNLWSDISEAGDVVPENEYGIALIWGDTVGSMYADYDNSYVGGLAERAYGDRSKEIDNMVVSTGGVDYDIAFAADALPGAAVPEPGSMLVWAAGSVCGLFALRRRQRRRR